MSTITSSFTGVKVVAKTTVAKTTVAKATTASFENVKKVRALYYDVVVVVVVVVGMRTSHSRTSS